MRGEIRGKIMPNDGYPLGISSEYLALKIPLALARPHTMFAIAMYTFASGMAAAAVID